MSRSKNATPESAPETALEAAPRKSSLGMLSHYSALPATEDAGIMTSLDLTVDANLVSLQHAIAGQSTSLWDVPPDKAILVTDLVAHYAERLDEETGELHRGPMLTLIGPEGIYHTGSQYAFRALQLSAMLKGPPPWNPPLRINAVRVRSRNKRDFQSILIVPKEE